jgi:hypothetical protein
MVTQGGVTTQLVEQGLCGAPDPQREGCARSLPDMVPELLSGELEGILRQAGRRRAERVDAARRGVGRRDERDDLTARHVLQDELVAADHAASPSSHRQALQQDPQAGVVDAVVEPLEGSLAAQCPGDDPRTRRDQLEALWGGMDPGPPPGELGAQIRVHHPLRVGDEAQELAGRGLGAAGDAASDWRHVRFILPEAD